MPARRAYHLLFVLITLCAPAAAQTRQLTLDDIFDPKSKTDFTGSVPRITWLPNGREYLVTSAAGTDGPRFRVVDASSGAEKPLIDADRLARALDALPGFGSDEAKEIARGNSFTFNPTYTAAVLNVRDDLYFYEFGADRATRLTSDATPETDVAFSPDGSLAAFVRDQDLFVVDVRDGRERALTSDGSPDRLNGRLDWVYEEEVYGRGQTRGYWWSPDSLSIAFLSLDVADVPEWVITDEVPQHQRVERIKYPLVGDPNPRARLGVVGANGGQVRWVDLSAYSGSEYLIVRVGWTPDSTSVVYAVQNRVQSWLELNQASRSDGKLRRLLREESQYWVEVLGLPEWLPNGSFLWLSDATGYRHVYLYGPDGKQVRAVTSGEWDVRDLHGVSADGWIYLTAAEHSPIADHVYRVKLDGTGFTRISKAEGHHKPTFNRDMSLFVDAASTVMTPTQTHLYRPDGELVRTIEANRVPALETVALGRAEFVKVPTRDGFTMEALMIKPPSFDPAKRYPVMSFTYAGPSAQSARDTWGGAVYMWRQMLAQRGYIVWVCDNRSSSGKGIKSAHTSFHRLGEQELRDLEDGVAWLKRQPYVDGARIGIQGWSFGGFMAAYAMTHSTAFKVGIAGAPVTDWRNYDSIYTERYMGLFDTNRKGYDDTSVIQAAASLQGKLLLIHGAIDDNVHVQNSIQLVDALQKQGKQFQFMIYPQSRHGVTNQVRVKHLYATMTDFILSNL